MTAVGDIVRIKRESRGHFIWGSRPAIGESMRVTRVVGSRAYFGGRPFDFAHLDEIEEVVLDSKVVNDECERAGVSLDWDATAVGGYALATVQGVAEVWKRVAAGTYLRVRSFKMTDDLEALEVRAWLAETLTRHVGR